jgi:hypothetical protein
MMNSDTFRSRLLATEMLSFCEEELDEFTAAYTEFALAHSHDYETLISQTDRDEWQERRTALSELVHRQADYVAQLYHDRIMKGIDRASGN